jgi:8-amino-7-oxononanoate synthase
MMQKDRGYSHFKTLLKVKREQRFYQHLSTLLFNKRPKDGLYFNSLDSLDLNNNSYIQKQALHQLIEWGNGTSSKSLVIEQIEHQYKLEEKISKLLRRDHCFVYQANATVQKTLITSFVDTKTLLIVDEDFAHRVAHLHHKHFIVVKRDNLEELEVILAKNQHYAARVFIAESISSFTGKALNLDRVCELCKQYNTITFIDDTNSIAIAGSNAMGLCTKHPEVDIVTASFAKSVGTYACFLATNEFLSEYFSHVNYAIDAFHLLAPASLSLLNASISLIPQMNMEREKLKKLTQKLKKELLALEYNVEDSHANIISLKFNNEKRALSLSHRLTKAKIFHITFSSTLHNKKTTHLRFILNCNHTHIDLKYLLQTLEQASDALMIQVI